MKNEIGSIMKFFHSVHPIKIYQNEVKEGFQTPSFYFPPPFSVDGPDTVSTFLNTYTLNVKVFDSDSMVANEKAENIANAVQRKRHIIPMIDQDGNTLDGKYLRIKRIETRVSGSGVAVIILTWDSRYTYDREDAVKMGSFILDSEVKS